MRNKTKYIKTGLKPETSLSKAEENRNVKKTNILKKKFREGTEESIGNSRLRP